MMYHSADVKNMTGAQVEKLVKDFTDAGWELVGSFSHGENGFHQFVQFAWGKESEPVAPKGYRL